MILIAVQCLLRSWPSDENKKHLYILWEEHLNIVKLRN